MSETNPEIEAQMDELAHLCCQRLSGELPADERSDLLLKSLLMSGYVWKHKGSFQADLEARVKSRCGHHAMHRGGELSSMSEKLEEKFRELARWESKSPDTTSKPKAANISSATDA
ncbi:hypothetical protein FYK55_13790 [Roseiconus nitratireducens]|uniref:Uncharacterized protein n=1 Tax=Roseiconus nitratireducens TaxID=2605748 RepID=A0A5M6D5H5_9BACT|nr:hypothetical protein [Roseiconus nitratireducens]KAA5542603.1 hypothetical protein FYK55_13790 [Roseiconus nitratireducens]